VQVRDRVCKDFTRPGYVPCCCTGIEHLGTATIQTHQNPQAQVSPLRYLSYSQDGATTRKRSSPRMFYALWRLLWEETGGQGPGLGFQPEPEGCFAWGISLSVDMRNIGKGLPLFLPQGTPPSAIYNNWGHTTQGLCCLLSSFLPSRQTGI
jgi:hypothetical protein